jgi:hypothetical protein
MYFTAKFNRNDDGTISMFLSAHGSMTKTLGSIQELPNTGGEIMGLVHKTVGVESARAGTELLEQCGQAETRGALQAGADQDEVFRHAFPLALQLTEERRENEALASAVEAAWDASGWRRRA